MKRGLKVLLGALLVLLLAGAGFLGWLLWMVDQLPH